MNPPNIEHFILCDCGEPNHSLLVLYKDWNWGTDPFDKDKWHGQPEDLTIMPHLSTGNVFWRLKRAWKYIWGDYQGHYDDVLLDLKETKKLVKVLNIYINWEEKKAAKRAETITT